MFGWTTAGLALSLVCSSIGDLVVLWNDFHVVLCIVVHIKFIGLKIEGRFKDNEGTSQKSQNIQHTSRSVFLPMPNCSCSGPIKAQAKLEEGLLAVLPASLHHLHRKRAKLRGWMRMSGRGLVSPEPTQGGAWIFFGIAFLHNRSMLGGGFLIRPLQSLS
ncbi:unnamed protein product [Musa acuminata var. zebrina]